MDFKELAYLKNQPTLEQYIKAKTNSKLKNAPFIIHDYEGYHSDDAEDKRYTDEEIADAIRILNIIDADDTTGKALAAEREKQWNKYHGAENYKGLYHVDNILSNIGAERKAREKEYPAWYQKVIEEAPDFDTEHDLQEYLNSAWDDRYPEDTASDHTGVEWAYLGPHGDYYLSAREKLIPKIKNGVYNKYLMDFVNKLKQDKEYGEGYKPVDYETAKKLRKQGTPVETKLSDGSWICTDPETCDLEMIRDYNGKLRIKDTGDSTPLSSSIIDAVDRSY